MFDDNMVVIVVKSIMDSKQRVVFGSNIDKIIEDIDEGKSVFITGKAGSGKTYLVNKLYDLYNDKKNVSMYKTGSTGIAAYGIEGTTINSFAGYGVLSPVDMMNKSDKYYATIKKVRENSKAVSRILDCTHLIIEEVSMIDNVVIDFLDELFRIIRNNDEVMGGIIVILVGDLLQLPPVSQSMYKNSNISTVLKSEFFGKIVVHYLTTSYRQEDPVFLSLLNRLRYGVLSKDDRALLKTRVKPKLANTIQALELFGNNRQVDLKNKKCLENINSELHTYIAKDYSSNRYLSDNDISKMNDKYTMYKKQLNLKCGARVMLLKNIDVNCGLVNGSLGSVIKCDVDYITVKFDNDIVKHIDRMRQEYEYLKNNYTRLQFPLTLAYACTIHKAQGITLDKVILNLDSANVYANDFGKVYVALSRCRTLDGIYIKNMVFSKVCADQNVVDWDKTITNY